MSLDENASRKPSVISQLDQQGSARIRFPNTPPGALHAVLLNTAGGLTGDDEIHWSARAEAHSHLSISTAACEKLYRSHGPFAHQHTTLRVASQARLEWLPQETIVFNGACLSRLMTVHMEADAQALLVESIVLGRQAMHEQVNCITLKDRWRIYQQGRLTHAEDVHLNTGEDSNALSTCSLHHYSAFSTLVLIADKPQEWFDNLTARIRARLPDSQEHVRLGVSAMNGKVIVRLLASDSFQLRRFLIPCVEILNEGRAIPVVWKV